VNAIACPQYSRSRSVAVVGEYVSEGPIPDEPHWPDVAPHTAAALFRATRSADIGVHGRYRTFARASMLMLTLLSGTQLAETGT
jgi:hypothetical protein